MSSPKKIFYITLVLIFCLAFFELTNTDIWLQQKLYNTETQHWLLDQPGDITRFIFYDGIKKLLILFAFSLLISLIFFRKKTLIKRYQKGLLIVFLSLIIVPSVVGILKASTNTACPKDTILFSGQIPYVRVFEAYPEGTRPEQKQRCFPAGHASGGFALMSLFFLFKEKRNRQRGLLAGLAIGWTMGNYKMIIGDHFLSHTVITMVLGWFLINLIVVVLEFLEEKKIFSFDIEK